MQGCGGWGRLVKVGGGAFVTPRLHDRLDYLIPRHASSQFRGKRGYRPCDLWLAAYGCDDLLRAVEQNGPMLQECVSFPDLRRAHQLATGDEYLAAYRGREARRRLVDPRGWWRLAGGQRGIGTEGPTSPPTGVAKQDVGWSTREGGGGWRGASVASAPRDRSAAAMRSWMVWYA